MGILSRKITIILAMGAVLSGGCGQKTDYSQSKEKDAPLIHENNSVFIPEKSPLRKTIEIMVLKEELLERPVVVPGVVEADPGSLIKIAPPVGGRVMTLHKNLGDRVTKGDPLFTLDSADLAQSYSEAAKAQEALGLAKRNLDRQKELHDAGIAAGKDLNLAESEYKQAVGEADRAKARLALLGVSLNQGNNRLYTLHAPRGGRIIELSGAQGAFWNDLNAPIMTIANLTRVCMAASVQEKDIGSVFEGQTAEITFNAYEDKVFQGKVGHVGEVFDPDSHTVKVRIALDNSSGRFRPGMFGNVTLKHPAQKVIFVPQKALVQRGFNTVVFVETAPWRFEYRRCKTGHQVDDRVEISAGLKAGDRIMVKEGVLLND